MCNQTRILVLCPPAGGMTPRVYTLDWPGPVIADTNPGRKHASTFGVASENDQTLLRRLVQHLQNGSVAECPESGRWQGALAAFATCGGNAEEIACRFIAAPEDVPLWQATEFDGKFAWHCKRRLHLPTVAYAVEIVYRARVDVDCFDEYGV